MSDEKTPPAPLEGQVLPPVAVGVRTPTAPLGLGAMVIAQNWSERKQVESHQRLQDSRNELLRALVEQNRLLEAHGISVIRVKNLRNLQETEQLKIQNELEMMRQTNELASLRKRVEIENLHADLAAAKQRRQRIENPTAPPPPPPRKSVADNMAAKLAEIEDLDRVLKAQHDSFIRSKGGEENLTPEDRRSLDRLEITRRTTVEKLYADLLP